MDVEFEGAHMIWDGVLCCTADDPEAYYAADARRVLELFVLAAEQGLELKADTLLAAAGAAPGVRSLSGRAAGAAAQRLLLSGAPEALGVLCAAGRMHLSGCRSARPVCMAWRRRPPCLWRGGGCICGGAGHPPCGTHRCAPRWNWTPLCRS